MYQKELENIDQFIVNKPHYPQLCDLDRERMRKLRAAMPFHSTMHSYHTRVMDTFDTVCHVKVKVGGRYIKGCYVMDGQKYVCMDDLMEDIRNNKCVVYSFGIGHDWSFEDNISKMGCKVYA